MEFMCYAVFLDKIRLHSNFEKQAHRFDKTNK